MDEADLLRLYADGGGDGFLLYQAHLAWQRTLTHALAPLNVTHAQFAVLAAIVHLSEDDALPQQREVSDYARLNASMTSSVLRSLVERGWVVRTADQRDGRASRLSVTTSGREIAERAAAAMNRAERAFFAGAEADSLRRGLSALVDRTHED